jgi:hypothetical protein
VPSISQRALGFFVIHLGGRIFGVKEPDASMLACSFGEVDDRVRRRGTHAVSFLDAIDAAQVAEAYLDAIYRDTPRTDFFGRSREEFSEAVFSNAVNWAPDGDEAFDDGSHVLQFDVGSRVRLVAFVNTDSPEDLCGTIIEEWLDADLFYDALSRWKMLFAAEWARKLAHED